MIEKIKTGHMIKYDANTKITEVETDYEEKLFSL